MDPLPVDVDLVKCAAAHPGRLQKQPVDGRPKTRDPACTVQVALNYTKLQDTAAVRNSRTT